MSVVSDQEMQRKQQVIINDGALGHLVCDLGLPAQGRLHEEAVKICAEYFANIYLRTERWLRAQP